MAAATGISFLTVGLGSGAKFSEVPSLLSGETGLGSGGISSGLTASILSFIGKNGYFSG